MGSIEIKKTTLIAAYLVVTAFYMGGMSVGGPYACPGDHGWQRVGMTLFAGAAWPAVLTASVLGYTAHDTKCLDGTPFIDPPKDR